MYSDIIILEKYVELAVIGIYAIGLKFAVIESFRECFQ